MDTTTELVKDLKDRVQNVRDALQRARLELEAIDRRVSELARQEPHHGC